MSREQPIGPPEEALRRLGRSRFRARFRLGASERGLLKRKGLSLILEHAARLIGERLAPALPRNDGRQTPYRGHPVFIAQHATATCCRTCLQRWHGIASGRALTAAEEAGVVTLIGAWLERELECLPTAPPEIELPLLVKSGERS